MPRNYKKLKSRSSGFKYVRGGIKMDYDSEYEMIVDSSPSRRTSPKMIIDSTPTKRRKLRKSFRTKRASFKIKSKSRSISRSIRRR